MMKSSFFPRKDELILSTITAFIVGGLLYQGITSWVDGREHAVFQKNTTTLSRK